MSTTIAVTKEVTTLINILTFEPENQQKRLSEKKHFLYTTTKAWVVAQRKKTDL